MAGMIELSRLTGIPKEQIKDLFDCIVNLTRHGNQVRVRGFGYFFTKTIKARTIISSAIPGGKAHIREAMVLRFKPAQETRVEIKARAKKRKVKKKK